MAEWGNNYIGLAGMAFLRRRHFSVEIQAGGQADRHRDSVM